MIEKTSEKKCPNCKSIDLVEIKAGGIGSIAGSNLGGAVSSFN